MLNPIDETIATYDQIAEGYLSRRQDRERLRPLFDRFAAYLPPGGRVLDVGCGPGYDGAVLRTYGFQLFSFDLSWGMMQAGRKLFPGDYVQADMRHLPLTTCADGLWLNASLLHLPRSDVATALQNMKKLLRPHGILFLTVKGGEGEAWTAYPAQTNLTRYFTYWSAEPLDELIQQAGFTLLERWQDQADEQLWLGRIAQVQPRMEPGGIG